MATRSSFDLQELRYSSSSVQGRRPYNEDRSHVLHPLLGSQLSDRSTSFFAVYDGHGGEEAAEWCSRHMHDCIAAQSEYDGENKQTAIEKGFQTCDQKLLAVSATAATKPPSGQQSGTTCGCVLIDSSFIYAGNCGDTRSILSRSNQPPVALSVDHKPCDPAEQSRIEAAGGTVSVQNIPIVRNGKKGVMVQSYVELGESGLAVSRALGDFGFKRCEAKGEDEQPVICRPYTTRCERRDAEDEFILMASDGLWNFVDTERCVEFVRERLMSEDEAERDIEDIVNKLTQFALDKKSNDNVTVLLVVLPHGLRLREDSKAARDKQEERKE